MAWPPLYRDGRSARRRWSGWRPLPVAGADGELDHDTPGVLVGRHRTLRVTTDPLHVLERTDSADEGLAEPTVGRREVR